MMKQEFADVKKTIWLTRPDLRALDEKFTGYFDFWLSTVGKAEYHSLRAFSIEMPSELSSTPWTGSMNSGGLEITELMVLIWRLRPDLQRNFDIYSKVGQLKYWLWYILHGRKEYSLSETLTETQNFFLKECIETAGDGVCRKLPRLLYAIWYDRPDLQAAFDLEGSQQCDKYVLWFLRFGVEEYDLSYCLQQTLRDYFLHPISSDQLDSIPRALAVIWQNDELLRGLYPVPVASELIAWFQANESDYRALSYLFNWKRPTTSLGKSSSNPNQRRARGVNLIGYAHAQLGIGEDVRMAAAACEAVGIPFTIYNISPGVEVCQNDRSSERYISTDLPYDTNIFCMTGIETARLYAVFGEALFAEFRNIGYWPWELSDWPEAWHHCYKLVDEIWASSTFTYNAFVKSSLVPVRLMPMAVEASKTLCFSRKEFGLPPNRFLFVFAFDVLSSIHRKNPFACVAAFQKAFPDGNDNVGLVIKAMRANNGSEDWMKLCRVVEKDNRVSLLTGTYQREKILDLYRNCDCFVSLHRSEGFGRGLVEAMLLGVPVIATGYSGNTDFTMPETSYCVNYSLRPLRAEEYDYGEGLEWAEPDIGSAAACMRKVFEDSSLRDRILQNAGAFAENTYSPIVVGRHYKEILNL